MTTCTMGIYKIENTLNNKVYVGSSKDIEGRWCSHKRLLKNNKHHSKQLQEDWTNSQGEDVFTFEIIEHVQNINDLLKTEQKYIESYDCLNSGYNTKRAGQKIKTYGDKLQIVINIDKTKDRSFYKEIYYCRNNISFIKNAIHYYITHIKEGKVIDRFYPYNS